jgi:hypothetical protein
MRLTTWASTARTMVATTSQSPTIAATTPITTAIAIAMNPTRTLVWEVIDHRLENSPVR